MTVPAWAWVAFAAFVIAMLALDLFVLHRRATDVSMREAAAWSALWVALGLGFAGVLWAWRGGGTAQTYLVGYLIEKSLSVDNVFVFAVIFSAFAIPPRYQHRVLMFGIVGALVMRAAFIMAGAALLNSFHAVMYVFGAVLLVAAVKMARGEAEPAPDRSRVLRALTRVLPATSRLHGQRFLVRQEGGPRHGRLVATPLLLALVVVETTDVTFAIDSIPAILGITTDTFVVYTSNVFALLGMRALYFLLAGAAARFRYLRPGLAVILGGIGVKMLTADLYHLPAWASPAFIGVVLAAVAVLSVRDDRRRRPAAVDAEDTAAVDAAGEPEEAGTAAGQTDAREPAPSSRGLRRAGTCRGNSSQRSGSRSSSRSRRRSIADSAADWLTCAATADRCTARAVTAPAPSPTSQAPGAPGQVCATAGTPACVAAARTARATAPSSLSPASGAMTSTRSAA